LKWTLLRGKRASAIAAALPTVSAFVVVATVIVAVGVMLTSTGRIFARHDKEHGEKKAFRTISDQRPEGYVPQLSILILEYDCPTLHGNPGFHL
jgi:hypothetical protein